MESSNEQLFPGQERNEKVELITKCHWINIVPQIFLISLVFVLLILLDTAWANNYQQNIDFFYVFIINIAVITITFHVIFIKILNYFLKVIIVTNYKIIDLKCTTFLHRERKTIDFINIQDMVVLQNGILKRLLNYGTIALHNAAGEEIFIFNYIPSPLKFYNTINHIYRKEISSHSRARGPYLEGEASI